MNGKENLEVIVKRIEKGENKKINIILECSFGRYDITLTNREARKFRTGQKFYATFRPEDSSLSDFPGGDVRKQEVITSSDEIYMLKNLCGKIVYKRK